MPIERRKLENVAIANALQLEVARCRAVPIRFNFVTRAKFELAQPIRCRLSVFTAYTLRYAVTLNFDPMTLTFDLLTLNTVKLCTKFERNQTIRCGVIAV